MGAEGKRLDQSPLSRLSAKADRIVASLGCAHNRAQSTEELFGPIPSAMLSVDGDVTGNVAGRLVSRGYSDVISEVNVPGGGDSR